MFEAEVLVDGYRSTKDERFKLRGGKIIPDIQNQFWSFSGFVVDEVPKRGKVVFLNQCVFKGEISEIGEFVTGSGTFEDDGTVWEGKIVNNKLEGEGVLRNKIGVFEGEFKHSLPNGFVKVTYENKDTFSGEMKGFEKVQGILKTSSITFDGTFQND